MGTPHGRTERAQRLNASRSATPAREDVPSERGKDNRNGSKALKSLTIALKHSTPIRIYLNRQKRNTSENSRRESHSRGKATRQSHKAHATKPQKRATTNGKHQRQTNTPHEEKHANNALLTAPTHYRAIKGRPVTAPRCKAHRRNQSVKKPRAVRRSQNSQIPSTFL